MQYNIKYKNADVIDTYYMPLIAEKNLLAEDIVYSARMIVAKFLGMSPFKIIAIDKCV